jgi:4-amino-4-deoxy-L-arabinose transferase-like glycosyltransferase
MLRRIPRPLALLLAVASLLTVAWTFATAPLQGPDEPAHFNYAQHLAETGAKPSVLTGDHPDSSQTFTALFFMNLDQLAGVADARPAWSSLEERRFDTIIDQLGDKGAEDGAGPNPLAKNPPLYYAYQVIPYQVGSLGSFWDRLTVMRLASGALFLLTVLFAWLAAAQVFAGTWPRLIAAGSVALLPQLTALSGTINSDNLLVSVWSAFTFVALRLVRRGASTGGILALCGLAGASLLTHGRGIAIVPALLVTLVVVIVRERPTLAGAARWLGGGAALLIGVALAYRFLLAPSTGAYGGEVNLGPVGSMSIPGFINTTWQFYLPPLPFMGDRIGPDYGYRQVFIEGFFGRFATLEVGYPASVYTLVQAACALGLVGLVVFAVGRRDALRARWAQATVTGAIALSMIGFLHVASYRALVGSNDPLITGRYVLPVVVAFGLAVAFVLTSFRARVSAVLGALVLGSLLALNLAGLMLTVTRFYG